MYIFGILKRVLWLPESLWVSVILPFLIEQSSIEVTGPSYAAYRASHLSACGLLSKTDSEMYNLKIAAYTTSPEPGRLSTIVIWKAFMRGVSSQLLGPFSCLILLSQS